MCAVEIKNTLAFLFPRDAAQPALADMVRFVKALNGNQSLMESAYKISDEKSVFIRFKCEEAMRFVLVNNDESLPFHYSNGSKVMVKMSVAGNTRYVRIYDLPPEVSDADVTKAMEKFGKVKRTVRERFPAEFQLDMFTGVRGIYMDIEKEIPDILYFCNRKGRVFYDGIKQRCFTCKSDTHMKKCCPILRERQSGMQNQQQPTAIPEIETGKKQAGEASGSAVVPASSTKPGNQQINGKEQQKSKKTETKRQLSVDSDCDTDPANTQAQKRQHNVSTSESENSLNTVSDITPSKERRSDDVNLQQRIAEIIARLESEKTFEHIKRAHWRPTLYENRALDELEKETGIILPRKKLPKH